MCIRDRKVIVKKLSDAAVEAVNKTIDVYKRQIITRYANSVIFNK